MQWLLVPFGWALIIVLLGTVFVPYVRGRSDLFTTWNLFLLGSANFVGFAAVQSGQTNQQYGDYTDATYLTFMMGATIFYCALFITYYALAAPRQEQVTPLSDVSDGTLLVIWLVFASLATLPFLPYTDRAIGVTGAMIGANAVLFAVTLGIIAVHRRPMNGVLWMLLAATILFALLIALRSRSRQPILNLMLAFPIAYYWLRLRYSSSTRSFMPLALGGAAVFIVVSAYGAIRWRNRHENEATSTFALESLQRLPGEIIGANGTDSTLGGDAVEVSMLSIQQFPNWADVHPFYSLYYVVVNPIPRIMWPDKPEALGTILPRDLGVWDRTGYVNWGPGVVGHGYHEGGLLMLIFYGFVIGWLLRYFDNKLVSQPRNPIFLAMLSASAGTLLALPRGDFGIYGVQSCVTIIVGYIAARVCRLLLGGRDNNGLLHAADVSDSGDARYIE